MFFALFFITSFIILFVFVRENLKNEEYVRNKRMEAFHYTSYQEFISSLNREQEFFREFINKQWKPRPVCAHNWKEEGF